MLRIFFLLHILALPASAEVDFRKDKDARSDIALIQACLESADTWEGVRRCVNVTYGPCIGRLDHDPKAQCIGREKDLWRHLLDIEERKLQAWALLKDNEVVETGAERPSVHAAVLAEQEAWQAFQQAQCAFDVAQFYGGTAAMTEMHQCAIRLIADRLFELRPFMALHAEGTAR